MNSIKHPASLGNILLFFGFIFIAYSSFVYAQPISSIGKKESGNVLADCDADGPYGEVCNESYEVDKKVRIKGDSTWKDKVTDVKEDDTVEFKVDVENIGDIEADNMKMTDTLPSEMSRTGGDGLTEEWGNFEPDEKESFIIEAKLNDKEFDTDTAFEKCVVNKAEAEQDGDGVGSDTATVCYNNADVEELPDTGPLPIGIMGMGFAITGAALKRKKNW